MSLVEGLEIVAFNLITQVLSYEHELVRLCFLYLTAYELIILIL